MTAERFISLNARRSEHYWLYHFQMVMNSSRATKTFQAIPNYQLTFDSFGSAEQTMRLTLGISILYERQLVCEVATGAPTHGLIEIGVNTAEAHRQRGLATIACAHLIASCEARGLSPWWDCAKRNIASTRLAHKLDFYNDREYRYVLWQRKNA